MNPVPRDHILPALHTFAPTPREAAEQAFAKTHDISEDLYRGDGLWEPHEVRKTSRRVLGYLGAWATTREPIYKIRAVEGLEALLAEQKPAGNFVWYHSSRDGLDRVDHCLYDTGIAGRAFILGAQILGDERYRTASFRSAEWAMAQPISPNNNYNLFAVWHLAAHYRATGEKALLESAIAKTIEGGLPGQLPTGGWPGHNSWIWYHGIILRGLAELEEVLPHKDPDAQRIRKCTTAALNRLIAEQLPTGQIPPNPGKIHDPHRNAFSLSALLIAERLHPEIRTITDGIMHHRLADFASVESPGKVAWPREVPASHNSAWSPDLAQPGVEDEWGLLPMDAFRCWVPGCESNPGDIVYSLTSESGPAATVRILRGIGNAGLGYRIPDGVCTPGQHYRLSARMKVEEPADAAGVIANLRLGAYGGEERGTWDPTTNCTYRVETPALEGFREIDVDFRAGDCDLVYFFVQNREVDEKVPVQFSVSDIQVRPLEREPEPFPEVPSQLDCDVMAFGLYLGYRYASKSMD